MHAIWFGKKLPQKRKIALRGQHKNNNGDDQTSEVSLSACTEELIQIERIFTQTVTAQEKEWEEP